MFWCAKTGGEQGMCKVCLLNFGQSFAWVFVLNQGLTLGLMLMLMLV
jgi:hypothetical protein